MSGKITIQDIIDLLAEKHSMTKKDAETFVKGMFELIEEALATEKYVKVKGLGTFKLTEVESRESVNVNTGERIEIQGHKKISFTPDSTMKDLINKPFAHFETVILNESTQLEDTETEIEGEEEEKEENIDATVSGNIEETVITEEVIKTDDNEMNAPQEQAEEVPVTADVDPEPVTEAEMTFIEETQIVELEVVQEETAETPAATITDEEKETSVIVESVTEVSVEASITGKTPEETTPETVFQQEEEIMTIADAAMLAAQERKTLSEAMASQEMIAETEPETQVNRQPEGETEKIEITEPSTEAGEPQENEKGDGKAKTLWGVVIAIILILCIAGGIYWYLQTENNDSPSQAPPAVSASQKETTETALLQDSTNQRIDTVKASTIDTTEGGSPTTATSSPQPQQSVAATGNKEVAKVTLADTVEYDITGTKTNYTLQEGESLIKVAVKFYGAKKLWPYIVKHNRSIIKNADRVPIGTTLRIPELTPKKQ